MSQAVSGVFRPDSTQKQNERTKIVFSFAVRSARVGGRGSCPASPDATVVTIKAAKATARITKRFMHFLP